MREKVRLQSSEKNQCEQKIKVGKVQKTKYWYQAAVSNTK